MSSIDYNEILLNAMSLVMDAKLQHLPYDQTIKCKITDDVFADEGKYIVSDGAINMEAFCDIGSKYKLGEMVYVTVPLGDYTQKKIITGKVVTDVNDPVTYVSPLDTMIDISGNLTQNSAGAGIVANGKHERVLICSVNLTETNDSGDYKYGISPQETKLYDTIGISANFKTMLSDKDIQTGNYGLCIDFLTYASQDGVEAYDNIITLYLDSNNMFGDPYNFSIPLYQAMKVNKGEQIIWGFHVYLYQQNNFK